MAKDKQSPAPVVHTPEGVKSPNAAVTTDATSGNPQQAQDGHEAWKQHFPTAAAAGGAREDYQKTADERRAQALLEARRERARQAAVEGEPVPSGEGDNPHEGEPAVDADNPNPTEPEKR